MGLIQTADFRRTVEEKRRNPSIFRRRRFAISAVWISPYYYRAFCKKTSKARSESVGESRVRPCLLQKNVKGTVETVGCGAQVTVPFTKKRQRHGRNCEAKVAADRAFRKKTAKARSKSGGGGRARPCLLQKNVKGTVEKCTQMGCATVPFAKKRQRHGRKVRPDGLRDRAFRKKTAKARSKSESRWVARPCLLQKSVKGTVEKWGRGSCATVPFTKKRQRHGRKGAGPLAGVFL